MDQNQNPPVNSSSEFPPQAPLPSASQSQVPPPTAQTNTALAIISYLGILVIVPLVIAKNDPFVKFHAKQGLALLIFWVISSVVSVVPIVGWIVGMIAWLATITLMVIGIVNAAGGKEEPLPIIGGIGKSFSF